jgi:hypothetical protein
MNSFNVKNAQHLGRIQNLTTVKYLGPTHGRQNCTRYKILKRYTGPSATRGMNAILYSDTVTQK